MDAGTDPRNVPAQPHLLATLTTTARLAIGGGLVMLLVLLGPGVTATFAVPEGPQQIRTVQTRPISPSRTVTFGSLCPTARCALGAPRRRPDAR